MKTHSKRLVLSILTSVMTLMLITGVKAFAAETLSDGEYTINVQALNSSTGELSSQASNAITNPVKLEVNNSKMYVILEMKDTMSDLTVKNSAGTFDSASKISQNGDAKTVTYKFLVDSIDEPVQVESNVAAMGRKTSFKINFDKNTIKAITTQAKSSEVKGANVNGSNNKNDTITTKNNGNVSNPKTGDNSFLNLSIVIFIASIMSISMYGSCKIKNRKVMGK
ncbi:NEAT domain-containing protein [Clostridium algidicarnis]|uniref:NEAT domain-containing protein n=1 Tax=Clostridium algidicarnis TaxID=37659 RepID=UPI001CF389EF|nr:NEAT domain-containing protein [Clostridium algidicarnis]MCB2287825.1 NEAT domain-containing protein [Clostridium algidicarnis]